ncbi:MAG TPA: amidohydrolase family protein, partial [Actinotalea sp.]|nr:amidohydrolase family protein [Actinotalea sp.]
MRSTLYHRGVVHSRTDPFAQALLVVDGQVAWLGPQDSVHAVLDGADEVVDLDGALVTPGFVDAHAHVLETGFALVGLDLSAATSLPDLLDAVARAARHDRASGTADPLLGHGWDETAWVEGRTPTREELDRAAQGAPVHLERVDGHGAVVSTAFADLAGLGGLPGWRADGWVTGAAHRAARATARRAGPTRRETLHRRALLAAAAAGIVSLHEHGSPDRDPGGPTDLLSLTRDPADGLPGVVAHWSQP